MATQVVFHPDGWTLILPLEARQWLLKQPGGRLLEVIVKKEEGVILVPFAYKPTADEMARRWDEKPTKAVAVQS